MLAEIHPSKLSGTVVAPASKSHSVRALFFAAFAQTPSDLHHLLEADDTAVMIHCLRTLGAKITTVGTVTTVEPIPCFKLKKPLTLYVGKSGLAYRLMTAVAVLFDQPITIDGDHSIRTRRPITPLVAALKEMGCSVTTQKNGCAPLDIEPKPFSRFTSIQSTDSQPITALIYLAALSKEAFSISYSGCSERPWLQLSLAWLRFLNIPYMATASNVHLFSHQGFSGFTYQTPGDWSAVSFFIAASIIHTTPFSIQGIDLIDTQPDKAMLFLFEELGGRFDYDDQQRTLSLTPPLQAQGVTFDLERGIDLLPILAVLGCFLTTDTHLYNGAIARQKESDRIHAMSLELKKMNAQIKTTPDGLIISPSCLRGATVDSHSDHRIAMALAIGASKALGITTIRGIDCIHKTFPQFFHVFMKINGQVNFR